MAPVTPAVDASGQRQPAAAHPIVPGRDEQIDALALLTLTMIGIAGFRPAYGGHGYLAVGAVGIIVGLLLSHAGQRARLPLAAVLAASALAFLLFGCVISQPAAMSVPTLRAVMNAAVSGWQQLLTTARPVGRTASLLALPYLLGLFSGVAGHALARRTATVLLPAAAPAVVVALSILFGAPRPVDAVLQGAGFAAVALAWAAVRQERGAGRQITIGRQRPWQRIAAGAVVLAVAGAGAVVIGPHLPGAGAHKRVVLTVVPPFDVSQFPSPLAAYRDYTKDAPPTVSVATRELLATTGLPPGALVRIAAMDSYDGLSWGVANAATTTDGAFGGFQQVGAEFPGQVPGELAGRANSATIKIESAYDQPWLPDVPGVTGISFSGAVQACGGSAAAALRFNVATGTGIIPCSVPAGLSYTVSYVPGYTVAAPHDPVVSPALSLAQLGAASPGGAFDPAQVCTQGECPPIITTFAEEHAQAETTPLEKVVALATYLLKNGSYSNGAGDLAMVTAGHSEGRLDNFLESKQIVGDDEQYAATMALLANVVGVPARVSLDGTVEKDGVIKGSDVRADVELDTAEYGWVTLPATLFTGNKKPTVQRQLIAPPQQPVKVVPPRQNETAPVAAVNQSSAVARSSAKPSAGNGFTIPPIVITVATDAGVPLLAVAGLAAALAAAKAMRRRRRRSFGSPATRVAGAWRELIDLSRDLGIVSASPEATAKPGIPRGPGPSLAPPTVGAPTRREFAAYAEGRGLPSARAVADAADAATFGPADPDGAAAARVWLLVGAARRGATAALPRWRRVWVVVNPRSLWASRAEVDRAVAQLRRAIRASGGGRGPRGGRGGRGSHGARSQRRGRVMPGGAYR